MLEKINDNAYRLELPSELKISSTFNVSDLDSFDAGDGDGDVLGSKPFQEEENDEDIQHEPAQDIPFVSDLPMTRSGTRFILEKFNAFLETLVGLNEDQALTNEY